MKRHKYPSNLLVLDTFEKKENKNHLVQTFLTTGHFWAGVAYIRTELVAFPYLWFWHFEFVIHICHSHILILKPLPSFGFQEDLKPCHKVS